MTAERVRHDGQVLIEITAPGCAPRVLHLDNLVVNTGLAWIAQRLTDSATPAAMSHMAMGSGSATALAANTALTTEAARVALSATTAGAVTTFSATFAPGLATGSVGELGIFNAAAGGVMLNRVAFPAQTKGAADTVGVTWTVSQTV